MTLFLQCMVTSLCFIMDQYTLHTLKVNLDFTDLFVPQISPGFDVVIPIQVLLDDLVEHTI